MKLLHYLILGWLLASTALVLVAVDRPAPPSVCAQ